MQRPRKPGADDLMNQVRTADVYLGDTGTKVRIKAKKMSWTEEGRSTGLSPGALIFRLGQGKVRGRPDKKERLKRSS